MNISANGSILATATRELDRRWDATTHHWTDAKATEFEQRFLVELVAAVERGASTFDDLEKLLMTIKQQCE